MATILILGSVDVGRDIAIKLAQAEPAHKFIAIDLVRETHVLKALEVLEPPEIFIDKKVNNGLQYYPVKKTGKGKYCKYT